MAKEEVLIALKTANAARVKGEIKGVADAADHMGDEAKKSNKELRDERGGNAMKNMKRAAFALGGALAGVGLIAKSSLASARTEAGALAQATNAFGEGNVPAMEAWANNAAKQMGLTRAMAYKQSAEIGVILGGFDIPQKQNALFTQNLVQRSADLARFRRMDQGVVQSQFAAAMQGRTRGLAKLGIQVNKTTLAQQAFDQGLIKSKKDALSPQAKAMATYSLIMRQTAKQGGQFAKDSDSWAVKQKIVQAQFENTKATLGTSLMPVFSAVMGLMQDGIGIATNWGNALSAKVRPAIETVSDWLVENKVIVEQWMQRGKDAFGVVLKAVDKLKQAVTGIVVWLADMYGEFRKGNPIVQGAALLIAAVTVGLVVQKGALAAWAFAGKAYTAVTKAMTFNTVAFNTALKANMIGIIVAAIIVFIGAMYMLYKRNEKVRHAIDSAWKWIKTAVGNVVDWLGPKLVVAGEYIGKFAKAGMRYAKWVVKAWGDVIGFFKKLPGRIGGFFSGMWEGIKETFRGGINLIIRFLNGFIDRYNNTLGGLASKVGIDAHINPITELWTGGHVEQTGWAKVGERGPELVKLPGGSTVYDAQQTAQASAPSTHAMRFRIRDDVAGGTAEQRQMARMVLRWLEIENAHA